MQTQQLQFLDFLGQSSTRFTIPFYQRAYSWTTSQCEELFEDIMRAGRENCSHFMSMVLFMENEHDADKVQTLDIIDGQQRIATMTILLLAFEKYLRENEKSNPQIDANTLRNRYLVVQFGNETKPKVQLIGTDRDTLNALVQDTSLPERTAPRVIENLAYFRERMTEPNFDAETFWRGMRNLLAITAEIDNKDKAQSIFESLNTKGLPLTAADLIRNYLLVAETRDEQARLYHEYWQPMEIMFEDDQSSSGSLKLNTGLRMWLSIRSTKMVVSDRSRTYYYFKMYMEQEYEGTTEELLDEMRSFCYLWAENYHCHEGRSHCSQFAWAKQGKSQTLVPNTAKDNDGTPKPKRPPLKRPLPGVNGFLPGWGHQSGF